MFKNHVIGAKDVSIHALVKRATYTILNISNDKTEVLIGFNPRPREEGDKESGLKCYLLIVSIHALVKRATKF